MTADPDARLDAVRAAVGDDPAHDADGCLVYRADCLPALRRLAGAGAVDLTVTSPPYNIGKDYEDPEPLDAYLDRCVEWLAAVRAATAPAGAMWLNVGWVPVPGRGDAVPLPWLLWERGLPFHLVQEVVWHYEAGVAARRRLSPRNEKLLWLVADPDDYAFDIDAVRDPDVRYPRQFRRGRLRVNPAGKNPSDVWTIPKVTSGRASPERQDHPAQMPLAVAERAVLASSRPGDLVLDPFLGSGTTAVAALRHGRLAVGFERHPGHCATAVRRIAAEAAAPPLFDPAAR